MRPAGHAQAHSAVTLLVSGFVVRNVSVHQGIQRETSGQLRFLGLRHSQTLSSNRRSAHWRAQRVEPVLTCQAGHTGQHLRQPCRSGAAAEVPVIDGNLPAVVLEGSGAVQARHRGVGPAWAPAELHPAGQHRAARSAGYIGKRDTVTDAITGTEAPSSVPIKLLGENCERRSLERSKWQTALIRCWKAWVGAGNYRVGLADGPCCRSHTRGGHRRAGLARLATPPCHTPTDARAI